MAMALHMQVGVSSKDDTGCAVSKSGPSGSQGNLGPSGVKGNQGVPGKDELQGDQGPKAEMGAQGLQRDMGVMGLQESKDPRVLAELLVKSALQDRQGKMAVQDRKALSENPVFTVLPVLGVLVDLDETRVSREQLASKMIKDQRDPRDTLVRLASLHRQEYLQNPDRLESMVQSEYVVPQGLRGLVVPAEFLVNEVGTAGPNGAIGDRGPAGSTGQPGLDGAQGNIGKRGKTDPRGARGPPVEQTNGVMDILSRRASQSWRCLAFRIFISALRC